jgi:tetratricopeptide (TPR) repeat protein
MDDYAYDLGAYQRPVTTRSPEAQTWFDRGLTWCYGFHHEEAIACFERALAADPDCAIAHWGIAYAIGPNYNKPWEAFDPEDLLLEQDRVEEAEAVYRADLGLDATLSRACQHPENVWVLHGCHECLTRLGKETEAALVKPRLDLALARADVPVTASCLCRLKCCG